MTYSKDFFKDYFGDKDSDHLKIHRGNQEAYEDNFSDLWPANKNAKILEIGCGAGQFLHYLKLKGYCNLEGVDIGEAQIDFLKKMDIKGCLISSISEFLSGKKEQYDIIVMNHVIEHLLKSELLPSLRTIYYSLKNKGVFIYATPNTACISGLFQRYIDFTHEVGFTERSAYEVMRIAGFRDIMVRGDRIRLKFRPKRILWWMLNKLWYKLLGFIYYIERGTDRPRVLSRELIVIGKK
ncbi:MAG: class I SAM-dependent methyltransferase [Candidatus Omnitrophota bacterium]